MALSVMMAPQETGSAVGLRLVLRTAEPARSFHAPHPGSA